MKKMTKIALVSMVSSLMFSVPTAAKTPTKATDKKQVKSPVAKAGAKNTLASKIASKSSAKNQVKVTTKQPVVGKASKGMVIGKVEMVRKNGKLVRLDKHAAVQTKTASLKPQSNKRNIVKASYRPSSVVERIKSPAPTVVVRPRVYKPASLARQYGLNSAFDPVNLNASVALVVDQNNWTTLYEKNASTPLPVASITKLMTAMVVLDAGLDMEEYITIDSEDVAHYRNSRLTYGTSIPRRDVMLLALMSSENRAAYALGRTYPGGVGAFVDAMNAKAAMLGMSSARFVDPSGLSSQNQASAMDLAKMVNAATQYKTIRELSTNDTAMIYTADGNYKRYVNSNRLISRNMGWDIGLQKTGTLSAAGKCLVLQTRINGTPKIMVFLDSRSADSRVSDAVKLKDWIESGMTSTVENMSRPVEQSLNLSLNPEIFDTPRSNVVYEPVAGYVPPQNTKSVVFEVPEVPQVPEVTNQVAAPASEPWVPTQYELPRDSGHQANKAISATEYPTWNVPNVADKY